MASHAFHPHYQSRNYNPLNGSIERWFKPFAAHIAQHLLLLIARENIADGVTTIYDERQRPLGTFARPSDAVYKNFIPASEYFICRA